jgi:phosphatidylserine decarboxylase
LGAIAQGRIFQAKGQQFTTRELLGGDEERAAQFEDGQFATIYLSPRDYHRVHMPVTGTLTGTCYIPGELFSVNTVTAENVDGLFARNERLVCYFDTDFGPMAMVLVGAMIVAGIETVWSGQVAPPVKAPASIDYQKLPETVTLQKGEEMGRFKLGSTVILLFPKDSVAWDSEYAAGTPTRLGGGLAARA